MMRSDSARYVRRRAHRVSAGAIALSVSVLASGCTDDDAPGGSDLAVDCGVVDESSITAWLGASDVEVSDESTDRGGSAQLLCRYTPSEPDRPTLVVRAAPESASDQAAQDVAASETSCETSRPLDVGGVTGFVCSEGSLAGGPQAYATWDGLDVRVALTETRNPVDDADTVLGAVVQELRDGLDRDSFARP